MTDDSYDLLCYRAHLVNDCPDNCEHCEVESDVFESLLGDEQGQQEYFEYLENEVDSTICMHAPPGWWCSRSPGHEGPCAARRFGDPL